MDRCWYSNIYPFRGYKTMTEKTLVGNILDELNSLPDVKAIKIQSIGFTSVGEPDIIGCANGQTFVIETKVRGNEPSKIQERRLSEWDSSGAKTTWLNSLEQFRIWFYDWYRVTN